MDCHTIVLAFFAFANVDISAMAYCDSLWPGGDAPWWSMQPEAHFAQCWSLTDTWPPVCVPSMDMIEEELQRYAIQNAVVE
jgi:hypothetical protein